MKHAGWIFCAIVSGVITLVLLFSLVSRRPPAGDPPPTSGHIRGVTVAEIKGAPDLIKQLTVQDTKHPYHGDYHTIKADVERELWHVCRNLPVIAGGDELLLKALDEVYTRFHDNYMHGYIFHFPYLVSTKVIELVDKLERDYPDSPTLPQALWLKAFALRIKPPPLGHETHEAFDGQIRWTPRPEEARRVYQEIARRFPGTEYAKEAALRAEKKELRIDPPVSPDEDPRGW